MHLDENGDALAAYGTVHPVATSSCMRVESESPKLYTGGAVDGGMAPDIYTDVGKPNDHFLTNLADGLNGFGTFATSPSPPRGGDEDEDEDEDEGEPVSAGTALGAMMRPESGDHTHHHGVSEPNEAAEQAVYVQVDGNGDNGQGGGAAEYEI